MFCWPFNISRIFVYIRNLHLCVQSHVQSNFTHSILGAPRTTFHFECMQCGATRHDARRCNAKLFDWIRCYAMQCIALHCTAPHCISNIHSYLALQNIHDPAGHPTSPLPQLNHIYVTLLDFAVHSNFSLSHITISL